MANIDKNKMRRWSVGLIAILFLEVFVFNLRHWTTSGLENMDAMLFCSAYGDSVEISSEDQITLKNSDEAWIEFNGMDRTIKTIYLSLEADNGGTLTTGICANDEANAQAFDLGTTTICGGADLTKYIRIHLSGKTDYLKIYFQNITSDITISGISFNQTVPLHISGVRLAIMAMLWMLLLLFRPGSKLYAIPITAVKKQKKVLLLFAVGICFQCVFFYRLGDVINPDENITADLNGGTYVHGIYNELADALIDGQVYLEREPSETMNSLENPYDPVERRAALAAAGEQECMDYAYFEGKYYCYFGVLPALLFYAPYKLLTGNELLTWHLVPFLAIVAVLAIYRFVYSLCKKYFPRASVAICFLCGAFLSFASSIVYLVYYGTIYSVPIICSLIFGILGLALWIEAKDMHKIKKGRLVAGSLMIALTLLCRPAFVLIFLMAIPIFWKETLKARLFFSKRGITNTICIMVPFLMVGVVTMCYNYMRFGSVFDFGAAYNLTSNDMTRRGFVFERLPLGMFEYIFQPITISGAFPYMEAVSMSDDYVGQYNREPFFGGMLSYNWLMLFIPFNIVIAKKRKI